MEVANLWDVKGQICFLDEERKRVEIITMMYFEQHELKLIPIKRMCYLLFLRLKIWKDSLTMINLQKYKGKWSHLQWRTLNIRCFMKKVVSKVWGRLQHWPLKTLVSQKCMMNIRHTYLSLVGKVLNIPLLKFTRWTIIYPLRQRIWMLDKV